MSNHQMTSFVPLVHKIHQHREQISDRKHFQLPHQKIYHCSQHIRQPRHDPIGTQTALSLSPEAYDTSFLVSIVDPETAAALILPLLAYKAAAMINGQRLQWYLDATIALAVTAFLVSLSKSM